MGKRFAFVCSVALCLCSCDDRPTRTRRVLESYAVVPGDPHVESGAPKVLTDDTRATDDFGLSTPRQCDVYQQLTVRKVDILWVVDSSGSMAPKQARLAANFNGFIQQLLQAQPPIDFHIAVTTTDTDDPAVRGKLRPWSLGGRSANYICRTGNACQPSLDGGTAESVAAFTQMSNAGTNGSAQERGLLAAYLALTNPENISTDTEERFIRRDAALYVVIVSDEDDASCFPLVNQPPCTADPGCRCAPDALLQGSGAYGATTYFTRFFETYKGYGRQELVTVAAIVALEGHADDGVHSKFNDPSPHVGCCRADGGCPSGGQNAVDAGYEVAYFGGRYIQVASQTGGVAVNICSDDFQGALSSLGYAASGLRREFRLSRGPELKPSGGKATGIQLFVSPPNAANCQVDANCPTGQVCRSNRCAQKVDVNLSATPNGAQYVKCDASAFRNVVRFDGTSVPQALSAVEICYDVQADFQTSCP